jgi:hypothetical protein
MTDNITVRMAVRCDACEHEAVDGAEIQGFGTDAEMEQMVGNQAADAVERIVERGHFTTHRLGSCAGGDLPATPGHVDPRHAGPGWVGRART